MCKTFFKILFYIYSLQNIHSSFRTHTWIFPKISLQILSFVKASHTSKTPLFLDLVVVIILTTIIPMGCSHISEIPLKNIYF